MADEKTRIDQLAETLLALINSKPQSPTLEELTTYIALAWPIKRAAQAGAPVHPIIPKIRNICDGCGLTFPDGAIKTVALDVFYCLCSTCEGRVTAHYRAMQELKGDPNRCTVAGYHDWKAYASSLTVDIFRCAACEVVPRVASL